MDLSIAQPLLISLMPNKCVTSWELPYTQPILPQIIGTMSLSTF